MNHPHLNWRNLLRAEAQVMPIAGRSYAPWPMFIIRPPSSVYV